jgi:hypothetical protein
MGFIQKDQPVRESPGTTTIERAAASRTNARRTRIILERSLLRHAPPLPDPTKDAPALVSLGIA